MIFSYSFAEENGKLAYKPLLVDKKIITEDFLGKFNNFTFFSKMRAIHTHIEYHKRLLLFQRNQKLTKITCVLTDRRAIFRSVGLQSTYNPEAISGHVAHDIASCSARKVRRVGWERGGLKISGET